MLTLFAVIGLLSSKFVFAEDMQAMGNESQQGQGMMGGQKQGGNPMMGMMPRETAIATADGGIVVLAGPRLIKYDKDLNLVKEVEMPRPKRPGQSGQNQPAEGGTPA